MPFAFSQFFSQNKLLTSCILDPIKSESTYVQTHNLKKQTIENSPHCNLADHAKLQLIFNNLAGHKTKSVDPPFSI